MPNNTQLQRYKKLLAYIDGHLKETIDIERVEAVCHYSYRNINRIFLALHNETIGKYIKRLRLEKAAQYLKYSSMDVSAIAYEVGFEDRAAFSKAFKSKYGSAPSAFRRKKETHRVAIQQMMLPEEHLEREALQYDIEYLPDFDYIFIEYRGDHNDSIAIEEKWQQLENYAVSKKLFSQEPIIMSEIIDDADISDHIHSRYNLAFILEQPLGIEPEGLFRTRQHQHQKYVKFTHKGTPKSVEAYYHHIYAFWMLDVPLELADLPTLEFYPNYEADLPPELLITEIYIPVQ